MGLDTNGDSESLVFAPQGESGIRDTSVRLAAVHSRWPAPRTPEAQQRLCDLVRTDDPAVKQQAATAWDAFRAKSPCRPCSLVSKAQPDRYLEHALVYALIQIDDREGTIQGLTDARAAVRRSTLIALAQIGARPIDAGDGDAPTRHRGRGLAEDGTGHSVRSGLDSIRRQAPEAMAGSERDSRRGTGKPGSATILTLCKDADLQELVARTVQQSNRAGDPGCFCWKP